MLEPSRFSLHNSHLFVAVFAHLVTACAHDQVHLLLHALRQLLGDFVAIVAAAAVEGVLRLDDGKEELEEKALVT